MELKKLKEQTRRQEAKHQEVVKKQQEMLQEEKKLQEAKEKKKLKKLRQAQKRLQNGMIEETFPAMVTIKKGTGKENTPPSLTVTFQGCTATQEKLLTSLVETQQDESSNDKTKGGNKQTKNNNSKPKQEAAKLPQLSNGPRVISKNVNVALAVRIEQEPVGIPTGAKSEEKSTKKSQEKVKCERGLTRKEFKSFGNLVLPPGITLTKVINGQQSQQPKINYSNSAATTKVSPPVNQKGVIVVDTEKLMQQTDEAPKPPTKSRRRKKTKNKPNAEPKMITIRNPTFQINENLSNNTRQVPMNQPVSGTIFTKTENGMVKITRGSK
ncbi:unnamed protein product [Ceutorhynchus assimilis]|uniref:Uncharacterized protein n=1 Tax=Ceutorhynchus assimilis TaxID=467358 RepID=A0A9N9MDR7_9CUCU|nr:unnamed protein product [Ceutorhynchus assimilis]